jgi:hypothetical protein
MSGPETSRASPPPDHVLDGKVISADLPQQAVGEWLAAAREKTGMYCEGIWEVEGWLEA